jgi:hypothetical protein
MFWYNHNASWWGYAGMAMTAAVVEGVAPAVNGDGEVDWRALPIQVMTMPGWLGTRVAGSISTRSRIRSWCGRRV